MLLERRRIWGHLDDNGRKPSGQEPTIEDEPLQEPEDDRPGRQVIVMLAVFFEAGLAPLSLLLGWLFSHPPLEHFSWSLEDALIGVAATVPLVLAFLAMLTWPIGPLSRVKKFCDDEVVPLLEKSNWSEIALISVSAGVGEEMLFRGVIQTSIASTPLGLAGGLVLSSLLFGLFHPISLTYMVIAAILGLYLGAVLIVGGNLLTSMVVHALYDMAALGYLLRIRPALEARRELVMIFPGATAMLELGLEWILLRERTKGCRKRIPGSHARPGARAQRSAARARLVPGLLVFFFRRRPSRRAGPGGRALEVPRGRRAQVHERADDLDDRQGDGQGAEAEAVPERHVLVDDQGSL